MKPAVLPEGMVLDGPRGQYQVGRTIGQGGFGTTYLGQALVDGRPVVVKALHLRGLPGWKALELFEREAAVLRALEHPLIPGFVDHLPLGEAEAPHGFALVMELVPGQSLDERRQAGGLPRAQLLGVLDDVLSVLAFIHGRAPPIVHRDVNPKNILLRPDGRAALVDFGSVQAALRAAEGGSRRTTAAGTFGYAPLEQFLGQATTRSDLYAAGMTFLALLTGREPEQLPLRGIAVDVPAVVSGDQRLVRLIEALVAPDPRDRLASAEQARTQLAPLVGRRAPAGDPAGDARRLVDRLVRGLSGRGFTVDRQGEVGQFPLVFHAYRTARGLGDDELHVYAAEADVLDGPRNEPLPPIPAALYALTVAQSHAGQLGQAAGTRRPGALRRLIGARPVVVPLVLCPRGIALTTRAHILHSLREPEGVVVVPALLGPEEQQLDVLRPRSLLGRDPRGCVDQVRRALRDELEA